MLIMYDGILIFKLFTKQTIITMTKKLNLGHVTLLKNHVHNNYISFSKYQTLTAAQRLIAQSNVGWADAPSDDKMYGRMNGAWEEMPGADIYFAGTYTTIRNLKSAGELVPGKFYRITNYQTTCAQSGCTSAGHRFDIIVKAIDNSHFSELASAAHTEGDTYFANSKLEAWKLWYCFDEDARFSWPDVVGYMGTIYRMIDEFGNDCPYDFKNIQFYRKWNSTRKCWHDVANASTGVAAYTFNQKGDETTTAFVDYSLTGFVNKVYDNYLAPYFNGSAFMLSNVCFFGRCTTNRIELASHATFGEAFNGNYLKMQVFNVSFGDNCVGNVSGPKLYNSTFGDYCQFTIFEGDHDSLTFSGQKFSHNVIEAGVKYLTLTNSATSPLTDIQNYRIKSSIIGTSSNPVTIEAVRGSANNIIVEKNSDGVIRQYCGADVSVTPLMTEGTWADIKALKDSNSLVKGQKYRITDFVTTSVQGNTTSAGHAFDIIVTAIDVNKFDEQASAIQHAGDTYFANSNLNVWKLWYCFDNNTSKYRWVSATGKGVIYRMIDEFGNDCPYDFKNIQYARKWNSTKEVWHTQGTGTGALAVYTFNQEADASTTECTDFSLQGYTNKVYQNRIDTYTLGGINTLPAHVFFGQACLNVIGAGAGNTFKTGSNGNILNPDSNDNIFGKTCVANRFGFRFYSNFICDDARFCEFGNNVTNNNFGYKNNGPSSKLRYLKVEDGVQYCTLKNTDTEPTNYINYYHLKASLIGTSSTPLVIDAQRNRNYITTVAKNSAGVVKEYCEADLVS